MDIQGAEGVAFKGMRNLLECNKQIKIIQEWWPSAITKYGVEPDSHLHLLEELGMVFYEIDGINDKLVPTTTSKLMKKYPNEDLEDINLFCTFQKNIE